MSSRLPQYVYPSTAYMAAAATSPSVLAAAMPHSSLSPTATAAGQFIDYSTAQAYASQFAGGAYEAYPYTTTANGFVTPAAAYTYAVPPTITAGGHAIHYQPQQIQERMQ